MAGNIIQNSTDKKAVYYMLKEIHHTFCGITFMWKRRNLYRIFSVCLYSTFSTLRFLLCVFVFFFGFHACWSFAVTVQWTVTANVDFAVTFCSEQCIYALFMDPQISFFITFFIKNGSHSTIHTFKNYFATVF